MRLLPVVACWARIVRLLPFDRAIFVVWVLSVHIHEVLGFFLAELGHTFPSRLVHITAWDMILLKGCGGEDRVLALTIAVEPLHFSFQAGVIVRWWPWNFTLRLHQLVGKTDSFGFGKQMGVLD